MFYGELGARSHVDRKIVSFAIPADICRILNPKSLRIPSCFEGIGLAPKEKTRPLAIEVRNKWRRRIEATAGLARGVMECGLAPKIQPIESWLPRCPRSSWSYSYVRLEIKRGS